MPYLIEQIARREAVDAWLGSKLIDDASVKTPKDVYEYNHSRERKVHAETLGGIFLDHVLHELPAGDEPPPLKARGITVYHYNQSFRWLAWWQANRHRFEFKTDRPLIISPAKDEHSSKRQVKIAVHDDVLDVYAVSTRYGDIMREAAEAMKLKLSFGHVRGLDVITTVRMKSVTFDEFLYILGKRIDLKGLDYRRTSDGYYVGS